MYRNSVYFLFLYMFCAALHANESARAIDSPTLLIDLVDDNKTYSYLNADALALVACSDIQFEQDNNHTPLINCMDDRTYLTTGNKVNVLVRHRKTESIEVTFKEVQRETLLSQQLSVLIEIADQIKTEARDFESPYTISDFSYSLTKNRAIVDILVNETNDADSEASLLEYQIITGPKEHWSLSADLLVSDSSQLKFDNTTKQLVEQDKPSEFHIGLNYHFGDTFGLKTSRLDNIYVKAFVAAKSRPLESYGVGIGYSITKAGSIFVAYNRFKEDALDSNGSVQTNSQIEDELQLGVSFDLGKALGWLKN